MNRLMWALISLVFLLTGVGGWISARGAGMAIPEWPGVFGRWFMLSPRPPLDVFLNQAHRVLAHAGLVVAVAFVACAWLNGKRGTTFWLAASTAAMLAAASSFGVARVWNHSIAMSRWHAVFGVVLLGLCAALATVASPQWGRWPNANRNRCSRWLSQWSIAACLVSYLFSFASISLRYLPLDADVRCAPFWTGAQLALGATAILLAGCLLLPASRWLRDRPTEFYFAGGFATLLMAQLAAGAAAWVASFGWPSWLSDHVFPVSHTTAAAGPFHTAVVTVHIMLGAAVPAAGVGLALWAHRSRRPRGRATDSPRP